MTSSVSTDVRNMRRGPGWAISLVAVGVLAGLGVAFASRGDGIAAIAALVDPSHAVTADVAKAAPQAPVLSPGAAAPVVTQSEKPSAGSCNADAVAAAVFAKVEAQHSDVKLASRSEPAPEHKVMAVVEARAEKPAYVAAPAVKAAPPPIVAHHIDPVYQPASQPAPVTPPPAPVAKAKPAKQNDVDSASAADALAKAQLEAALSR
jgi:hypothetical protein